MYKNLYYKKLQNKLAVLIQINVMRKHYKGNKRETIETIF